MKNIKKYRLEENIPLIEKYFKFTNDNILITSTKDTNIEESDLKYIRKKQEELLNITNEEYSELKRLFKERELILTEKQIYRLLHIVAAIREDVNHPNKHHIKTEIKEQNEKHKSLILKENKNLESLYELGKLIDIANIKEANFKTLMEFCEKSKENLGIKISVKSKKLVPNNITITNQDPIFKLLLKHSKTLKKVNRFKEGKTPEWNKYKRDLAYNLRDFL